jgi:hypothetical protein
LKFKGKEIFLILGKLIAGQIGNLSIFPEKDAGFITAKY